MSSKRSKLSAEFDDADVPSLRDRSTRSKGSEITVPLARSVDRAAILGSTDYQRLKQAEDEGKVILDIPVNLIKDSPYVNRSPYYFKSQRYEDLRTRIEAAGGINSAIRVRPIGENDAFKYELVFGRTRLQIYRDCNWMRIPAVVQAMSDKELVVAKFGENDDREDLSPYDYAKNVVELLQVAYDGNRAALAKARGKTNSWISQQISIASMPDALLVAYPILHTGATRDLLELSQTLKGKIPDGILELPNARTVSNPKILIRKINSAINKPTKRESLSENVQQTVLINDANGAVLARVKALAKQGRVLTFPTEQADFAEFIIENLPDIYSRFIK